MCDLQEQKKQEILSLDNYVTYNEALIDERDQGIAEIGQQINEVHEIFQVGLHLSPLCAEAVLFADWTAGIDQQITLLYLSVCMLS